MPPLRRVKAKVQPPSPSPRATAMSKSMSREEHAATQPPRPADVAATPQLARQGREGGGATGNHEDARAHPPLPRWSRFLVVKHLLGGGQESEAGAAQRGAPLDPSPTRHRLGSALTPTSPPRPSTGRSPVTTAERLLRERQAAVEQGCRAPAPFHCWRDHSDDDGDGGTDADGGVAGRAPTCPRSLSAT